MVGQLNMTFKYGGAVIADDYVSGNFEIYWDEEVEDKLLPKQGKIYFHYLYNEQTIEWSDTHQGMLVDLYHDLIENDLEVRISALINKSTSHLGILGWAESVQELQLRISSAS